MKNYFKLIAILFFSHLLNAQTIENDTITRTASIVYNINGNQVSFNPETPDLNQIAGAPTAFYTYYWEFGDGETSTLQEPTHVFEQQGAYEVKLFAGEDANDDGEFDELDEPDIFTLMLDVAPNNTSIDVIIKDATTWSQESPSLDVVENAEVNLYADQAALDADQAAYTKVSNELGQVIFYDLEEGEW